MTTGQAGVLVRRIYAAAGRGDDRVGDAELLSRFLERRDEAAFAALVRRHGPMVLAVARRQLHSPADAEDVVQATFLLLARRAGQMRRPEAVGSWLYGVAVRLARRLRLTAARRRDREARAGRMSGAVRGYPDPAAELKLCEARAALDNELSRLPEKFRAPLVLCCLEGRTRDEAAEQLGWPVNLLKSRLEQARSLLRRRLVRRGLTVPAVLAAGLFAESAAVGSGTLTRTVLRAALRSDGVSPRVLALAADCGRAMPATARAALALALVAALSAGTGLSFLSAADSSDDPPAAKSAPPPAAGAARSDRHGDALPDGALLRIGTIRYRCGSPNDAALSADGKTLATASGEEITLWDVATGRPLHRLRDAGVPPDFSPNQSFLCFSPDGKQLVSIGDWDSTIFLRPVGNKPDAVVHVWDVASGDEIRRIDLPESAHAEHYVPVRRVWFTPGGKELAVMLHSGVARFLDPTTGKEIRRRGVGNPLRLEAPGVAPSPDGKLVAVIDSKDERSLLLFDPATGREVRRVAMAGKLGNVAFSPDSTLLAVVTDGSVIHLLDAATGKERKSITAPVVADENLHSGLLALTFSPDGKILYGGSLQAQILRWRVPGGEALPALPADPDSGPSVRLLNWVTGIFPSPDGRSLISTGWGRGVIRRWDTAADKEIPPPEGFTGSVCALPSPDGRRLAVGDSTGKVEVYETATGRRLQLLRAEGAWVTALSWTRDGKTLAVGQMGGAVGVWDVASGTEVRVVRLPGAAQDQVSSLAFGPDGRHLLASFVGLRMWDVQSGEECWAGNFMSGGAFSPDGKTVAARSNRNELVLLEADTGAVRATCQITTRGAFSLLSSLAYSPDGGRLATAHVDGTIRLHSPKTGQELSCIECPKGASQQSLAFSPDGKWLFAGGRDKVVRLLEVPSGKELLRLTGHEGSVTAAFGVGIDTAVSSSGDSTVLVWDLRPRGGAAPVAPAELWNALASDDGATVYRTVRALAAEPKAAALLREKIPVRKVDEKRVRQLVAGLDADGFDEREKSARELAALGSPAVPLLRKLAKENAEAEIRRRLEDIVEGLVRAEAADFRLARAVQVLELSATPEARQLLRDWSTGASSVSLANDARAALDRLERFDKMRRAADKP